MQYEKQILRMYNSAGSRNVHAYRVFDAPSPIQPPGYQVGIPGYLMCPLDEAENMRFGTCREVFT